jgi:hypothetical protein
VFRKIATAAVVVAVLSWLFVRTLRETTAAPYEIDGADLSGWTLALTDADRPDTAILQLRPPDLMPAGLFRQIFQRSMQSLRPPPSPGMPLVLRGEYVASLQGVVSPEELADLAGAAGLEGVTVRPVCLAVKREPVGARSAQLFFLLLDVPAFDRFRADLARLHADRGGVGFDPASLRPVLPIAWAEGDYARWWPLAVNAEDDCEAPLAVDGAG